MFRQVKILFQYQYPLTDSRKKFCFKWRAALSRWWHCFIVSSHVFGRFSIQQIGV